MPATAIPKGGKLVIENSEPAIGTTPMCSLTPLFRFRPPENNVLLTVIDSGQGIAPEASVARLRVLFYTTK